MSNTPSDAEIVELAMVEGVRVRTGRGAIRLARAVLAKWGTPQPVVREPLTPSQYNNALGCATDIPPSRYEAVTRAIERAHGIKGGQHGTE